MNNRNRPMDWLYLLNSFHGRIGRQTFWIAMVVCHDRRAVRRATIAEQIQGDRLSAIVDLAFTYPEFAVAVKRAHDRNMPNWVADRVLRRRRVARSADGARN